MTRPGSIGSIVPPGDDDVYRQLAELKRQIAELRTARVGNAMTVDGAPGITVKNNGGILIKDGGGLSINDGGDIAINDGGTLSIYDASGRLAVFAGFAAISGHTGLAAQRPDGTTSFQADDSAGGFVGIFDRAENIVISDDAASGAGLASPHLPLDRPADTNIATWPSTTAGTWTGISIGFIQRQNPGFTWSLYCQADPATTGRFRIKIDGTVVATSPAVTGAFSVWSASYYWPAGWDFASNAQLLIEAEVTAGAGTIRAQFLQLIGVQS